MGLCLDSSREDVSYLSDLEAIIDILEPSYPFHSLATGKETQRKRADIDSKRVFLLGPSHHSYLSGVALSSFAKYATPIGDIPLCLDSKSHLLNLS